MIFRKYTYNEKMQIFSRPSSAVKCSGDQPLDDFRPSLGDVGEALGHTLEGEIKLFMIKSNQVQHGACRS